MHLQFISFLKTEPAYVAEIIPHRKEGAVYPAWSKTGTAADDLATLGASVSVLEAS